jgi:hypothetical protein
VFTYYIAWTLAIHNIYKYTTLHWGSKLGCYKLSTLSKKGAIQDTKVHIEQLLHSSWLVGTNSPFQELITKVYKQNLFTLSPIEDMLVKPTISFLWIVYPVKKRGYRTHLNCTTLPPIFSETKLSVMICKQCQKGIILDCCCKGQ